MLGPRIFSEYAEDVSELFNIITYVIICLLTTCSVTAAEYLLKLPQWSRAFSAARPMSVGLYDAQVGDCS